MLEWCWINDNWVSYVMNTLMWLIARLLWELCYMNQLSVLWWCLWLLITWPILMYGCIDLIMQYVEIYVENMKSKLLSRIIESILGIHAFISPICRDMQRYLEGSIGKITSDIQWYHMHVESCLGNYIHMIYVNYVSWWNYVLVKFVQLEMCTWTWTKNDVCTLGWCKWCDDLIMHMLIVL